MKNSQIKLTNSDLKMGSLVLYNKQAYDLITNHFLTYKNDNPISDSIIVTNIILQSILKKVEDYSINQPNEQLVKIFDLLQDYSKHFYFIMITLGSQE